MIVSWAPAAIERGLDFSAGVFVLPLAGFAACPVCWSGSAVACCRWRLASASAVTGLRLVRPSWLGRAAGWPEQAQPLGLGVPAVRQVQGQIAAAVAGCDVDEVAAEGGAAVPGVERRGQAPGGAQQVGRGCGAGEAGGVGGK